MTGAGRRLRRFADALPVVTHELLQAIGRLSHDMGFRSYLVGGIVRDIVIGYPNIDLDVTVDGDGVAVAEALAQQTCSMFKGPTRFGTCKVVSKAFGTIDFATTRLESYKQPGALPDVTRSTLERDLARRDFTINAMAISLDPGEYGRLIDPFGGLDDIAHRRLRILHVRSFIDDPTRILRGIRFAARYRYPFEPRTARLLRAGIRGDCLVTLTGKRVYAELRLICAEDNAPAALRLLHRYDILRSLDLAGAWHEPTPARSRKLAGAIDIVARLGGAGFVEPWVCWFSALCLGLKPSQAVESLTYFNPPRHVRETCLWVSKDLMRMAARLRSLKGSGSYGTTKLLRGVPPDGLPHLYEVSSRRERGMIRSYLGHWRHVRPYLSGGEISSMGVGEGPRVGRLLDRILRLRLEGRLQARSDEVTYVKSYIEKHPGVRAQK